MAFDQSSGLAASMAPSTPPPPRSDVLALTMASTSSFVMSPVERDPFADCSSHILNTPNRVSSIPALSAAESKRPRASLPGR
jgi:hypothetical protein